MSHNMHKMGTVYTASFFGTTLATTGPYDLFGILPPTNSRVAVYGIELSHRSTERISFGVQLLRGSTASSTSAGITPRHVHGWSGVPTAGSSVTGPSSGLASTASAVQMAAGSFSENKWTYSPDPARAIILDVSQRLHVRVTQTTTTIQPTLDGVIHFGEIGKPAG